MHLRAARYINCYEAAVHRVQFIGCDLTGAVLQSVSVRELAFSESRLTGAELFGTPLAGVDIGILADYMEKIQRGGKSR